MKIYISNSGLSSPVEHLVTDAKSKLSSAKANTATSPNGFSYASFVNSLPSKIDEYSREADKILKTIKSIEKKYDSFLTDQCIAFKNINECSMSDRKGISKKIDDEAKYNISGSSLVGFIDRQKN